MTKPTSCLDCLLQRLDLALKKHDDFTEDDSDDDDSSYGSDDDQDDLESDVETDQEPDEQHFMEFLSSPSNGTFRRNAGETNLFKAVEGRDEVFQNIMRRTDSVE